MTSEQKIVQYLNEAHALEAALVQTLTAHIAMTPEGPYRDLLERHLDETREQAERILGRLAELGEGRNPLQLVYGIAQTAIGQVVSAGKFPIDLLRGTGGEEKLLKNARDEASTEALEIATYDSIEAFATAAGDDKTAVLAREHRAQEETFLAQLREQIGELARAVHAAEVDGDPSYDASQTGAAQAARGVAGQVAGTAGQVQAAAMAAVADVQRTAMRAAGAAAGAAGGVVEVTGDLAEEAAEELVEEPIEELVEGVQDVAEDVAEAAERVTQRAREAARRSSGGGAAAPKAASSASAPKPAAEATGGSEQPDLPIDGYDDLPAAQVVPKLRLLSQSDLARIEEHERNGRARKQILNRITKLRSSTAGQPVGTSGR
jgi:ferritin-like metal-binding protein YciE